MRAHIISGLEELTAFKRVWKRLYDSVPDTTAVFSSWEYIHAYVSFYQPPGWLAVVLYPDQAAAEPVAIFPLELFEGPVGQDKLRICRSLGAGYAYYSEYLVAPSHRQDSLNTLIEVLKRHLACDALLVERLHENSQNYLHLLETVAPGERRIFRRQNAPFIETRSLTFEKLFSRSSQKTKTLSDTRRRMRRLSELGKLEFSTLRPTAPAIDQLLERHVRRFAGRHHFDTPGSAWQGFIRHLAGKKAYRDILEYGELTLDGAVIAAHLSFVGKGRKIYALPVHDESLHRYSPAKVHLLHLIERAFAEQAIFCFGPALYPYKEEWCQAIAEVKFVWIFLSPAAERALPERAGAGFTGIFDQPAGRA